MFFKNIYCLLLIAFLCSQAESRICTTPSQGALELPSISTDIDKEYYEKYFIKDNVDLYTGQVAFSIPLFSIEETGLQPISLSLNLSYHGDILQELYSSNDKMQSSWVGLGFSFSLMNIMANTKGTREFWDDEYVFDMGNGNKTKLIPVSGETDYFQTEKFTRFKIKRILNVDDIIAWDIIDDNGIHYILGDSTANILGAQKSTVVKLAWGNWIGNGTESGESYAAVGWYLSKIRNSFGNWINISYDQDTEKLETSTLEFTKGIYPAVIESFSGKKIVFTTEERDSSEWLDLEGKHFETTGSTDEYQEYYERRALDLIQFYINDNLISQKIFYYDTIVEAGALNEGKGKRFLESIVEENFELERLPSYRFSYYWVGNGEAPVDAALKGKIYAIITPSGGEISYEYTLKTENDFTYESLEPPFETQEYGWPIAGDGRNLVFSKDENEIVIRSWNGFRFYNDYITLPFSFPTGDTEKQATLINDHLLITDRWDYDINEDKRAVLYKKTPRRWEEKMNIPFPNVYDVQLVNENYILTYQKIDVFSNFNITLYKIENYNPTVVYSYNGLDINLGDALQSGGSDVGRYSTLEVISMNNNHIILRDGHKIHLLYYNSGSWSIKLNWPDPVVGNDLAGYYLSSDYSENIVSRYFFNGSDWIYLSSYPTGYPYGQASHFGNLVYFTENRDLKMRRYKTPIIYNEKTIEQNFLGDPPHASELLSISFQGNCVGAEINHWQDNVYLGSDPGITAAWMLFIKRKKNLEHIVPARDMYMKFNQNTTYPREYLLINGDNIIKTVNTKKDQYEAKARLKEIYYRKYNHADDTWGADDEITIDEFYYYQPGSGIYNQIYWNKYARFNRVTTDNFLGYTGALDNDYYMYIQFDPRFYVDNGEMKLKIPVINKKTINDGHGNLAKSNYIYDDGVYRTPVMSLNFNSVEEQILQGENLEGEIISRFYNDLDDSDGAQFGDLDNTLLGNGYELDGKLYHRELDPDDSELRQFEDYNYTAQLFEEENGIYDIQLKKSKIKKDNVESVVDYDYNTIGLIREKTEYNSNDTRRTYTKYAHENPDDSTEFQTRNLLTYPYLSLIGDANSGFNDLLSSTDLKAATVYTYNFDNDNDTYVPDEVLRWNDDLGVKNGEIAINELIKESKLTSYDDNGLITEMVDGNDVKTAFKYGYNSALIMAKIKNSSEEKSFVDDFGQDLSNWTKYNPDDSDTEWIIEGSQLKQKNYSSASSGECDRIYYDNDSEILGTVVLEFDCIIANSNKLVYHKIRISCW
jgi:hypothetical protein